MGSQDIRVGYVLVDDYSWQRSPDSVDKVLRCCTSLPMISIEMPVSLLNVPFNRKPGQSV